MTTLSLFRKHEPAEPVDEDVVLDSWVECIDVEAGDVIVRQGEVADAFYVILDGTFQVMLDSSPRAVSIGVLGPGDSFGETGLLLTGTRTASVVASTPGQVVVLGRSELQDIMTDAGVMGVELSHAAFAFTTKLDWQPVA